MIRLWFKLQRMDMFLVPHIAPFAVQAFMHMFCCCQNKIPSSSRVK